MAKLTEKDLLSSPELADELFGNDVSANAGIGKIVRIGIATLRNLILGNRTIGEDNPGSIVTLDGSQTVINKIIEECTLKKVALDVDTTVDIGETPTKIGEAIDAKASVSALASKENISGPSERGAKAYLNFTAGVSGAVQYSDEDILEAMGYSGDELVNYALDGRSLDIQLREKDGEKYFVLSIDNDTIVAAISPDTNGELLTLELSGLTNATEYDLAITAKVIDRP